MTLIGEISFSDVSFTFDHKQTNSAFVVWIK